MNKNYKLSVEGDKLSIEQELMHLDLQIFRTTSRLNHLEKLRTEFLNKICKQE